MTFLTMLLVGRPMVAGEDPGLLLPQTNSASLACTQLTLVLLVMWLFWRLVTGDYTLRAGLIDICLLGIVGLSVASSALAAHFKHPAWVISWEWFGFFCLFFLTRQLAITDSAQRGLLCTLLATGVMLAASGLYQIGQETPETKAKLTTSLEPKHPEETGLETRTRRGDAERPGATFTYPTTFASILLLTIPGLIVALVLAWRAGRGWLAKDVLALAVLASLAALYLTGQVMPLLTSYLNQSWTVVARMIFDHPLFGVGPGNFSRDYSPRLQPQDGDPIPNPLNLFLGLASSAGLLAAILLLVALVSFYRTIARHQASTSQTPPSPEQAHSFVPWEFYLGGMLGMVLALVLRLSSELHPIEMFGEAKLAAVRSLVWFLSFAVLESTVWPSRSRALALVLGITAFLFHQMFAPGFDFPSLAVPFWIAVALALNSTEINPGHWVRRPAFLLILAVPIAFTVALLYLVTVLSPITYADSKVRQAEEYERLFEADQALPLHQRSWNTKTKCKDLLEKAMLKPLQLAAEADPENPRIAEKQALRLTQLFFVDGDPEVSRLAILQTQRAQKLDPQGVRPLLLEANLRTRFARPLVAPEAPGLLAGVSYDCWLDRIARDKPVREQEKKGHAEYRLAADSLQRLVKLDPTNPQFHYQLAETLFRAGDNDALRQQAQLTKELDEQTLSPARKLTEPQRDQVRFWLRP